MSYQKCRHLYRRGRNEGKECEKKCMKGSMTCVLHKNSSYVRNKFPQINVSDITDNEFSETDEKKRQTSPKSKVKEMKSETYWTEVYIKVEVDKEWYLKCCNEDHVKKQWYAKRLKELVVEKDLPEDVKETILNMTDEELIKYFSRFKFTKI